jgi:hypothetical protein
VLSTRQARKIYGFDLLVAMHESPIYTEYLAFFACLSRVAAGRLGASGGWRLAAWLALEWLPFAIAPSKCMMWFRKVVRYGTGRCCQ